MTIFGEPKTPNSIFDLLIKCFSFVRFVENDPSRRLFAYVKYFKRTETLDT